MKAAGVPALSLGSSLIGVPRQTLVGQSMPSLRAIHSTNRVYIEPPMRHLTEEG